MSNLVKRLRRFDWRQWDEDSLACIQLVREAYERIEALEAELARARAAAIEEAAKVCERNSYAGDKGEGYEAMRCAEDIRALSPRPVSEKETT